MVRALFKDLALIQFLLKSFDFDTIFIVILFDDLDEINKIERNCRSKK